LNTPEEDPSQPSLSLEEAIEETEAETGADSETEAATDNEAPLQPTINEGPTHE
jgi:hypothetical protein